MVGERGGGDIGVSSPQNSSLPLKNNTFRPTNLPHKPAPQGTSGGHMATLKQRHHKFEARVRIPAAMQDRYEGRSHLYRTLAASDRRAAKLEADAWELSLRADWATRRGGSSASLRQVYDTFRQIAESEELTVHGDPHSFDEVTAGLELELERMQTVLAMLAFPMNSRAPTV